MSGLLHGFSFLYPYGTMTVKFPDEKRGLHMNHVTEYLNQITASSFSIFGMIFLGMALLNCFLGYRLKKLWIGMIGFLLGIAIGAGITSLFSENKTVILAAGLVVGILAALLSFRLYLIGVFFYAALSVYPLIAGLIGKELWWEIALSVIAAFPDRASRCEFCSTGSDHCECRWRWYAGVTDYHGMDCDGESLGTVRCCCWSGVFRDAGAV